MKLRAIPIVLAAAAVALSILTHNIWGEGLAQLRLTMLPVVASVPEVDSPCFYRKPDGTVVDMQAVCGKHSQSPLSGGTPQSRTGFFPGAAPNPAMKITAPNDPGVMYLSGSGANSPAIKAASQAEWRGR